jgi:hypothetical protein
VNYTRNRLWPSIRPKTIYILHNAHPSDILQYAYSVLSNVSYLQHAGIGQGRSYDLLIFIIISPFYLLPYAAANRWWRDWYFGAHKGTFRVSKVSVDITVYCQYISKPQLFFIFIWRRYLWSSSMWINETCKGDRIVAVDYRIKVRRIIRWEGHGECLLNPLREASAESIEWFIDDHAFSPLYGLAPPPLLFSWQVVSRSQSSCVSPVELTDGRGERGGGGGAKSYEGEKAWSSLKIIQYSL